MTVLTETRNTPEAWSERANAPTSHEAAGWSRASQNARFEIVADRVRALPGERLLDFGCGTGSFSTLLHPDIEYVGYDWAAGMIARARRDHPERQFTDVWPSGRFDVIVCIGPFNLPGSKHETWHTLRHLWDTTDCRLLAVSLYAGDDDRCLIYDETETLERLGGFSYLVGVERWRRNDILAVIKR